MSDSRRSPSTAPPSGGKGPASRTRSTHGSRSRSRTPKVDSAAGAKPRRAPRGADKGSKGTDNQSGAATGTDEARSEILYPRSSQFRSVLDAEAYNFLACAADVSDASLLEGQRGLGGRPNGQETAFRPFDERACEIDARLGEIVANSALVVSGKSTNSTTTSSKPISTNVASRSRTCSGVPTSGNSPSATSCVASSAMRSS